MSKLASYLDHVFVMLDEFLNAIFGGSECQTISLRAADAAGQHKLWGCLLCKWLSITVERQHCQKTIEGVATVRWAAVAAAIQLALLFFLIFYVFPWVLAHVVR